MAVDRHLVLRRNRLADDGHHGTRWLREGFFKCVQLTGKQRTGAGHRGKPGHAMGGGLGPVGGAEGVHDKHLTQSRIGLRQGLVVFLFARVEAFAFQQGNLSLVQFHAQFPVFH